MSCSVVVLFSVQLYGAACDGIFFDESPYLLGTFVDLYKAHNTFAHAALDGTEVGTPRRYVTI